MRGGEMEMTRLFCFLSLPPILTIITHYENTFHHFSIISGMSLGISSWLHAQFLYQPGEEKT